MTTLGATLLEPTRIYVREVLQLLQRGGLDALAHITGGGLTENIVRVVPTGLGIEIDLQSWRRPAVFDWLQQNGDVEEREMLRTFNCGIGMVMVASPDAAADLAADCRAQGLECFEIGGVVPCSEGPRVRYL
jgi:phosphoribosylformylglycinamidine cyclo-ligase